MKRLGMVALSGLAFAACGGNVIPGGTSGGTNGGYEQMGNTNGGNGGSTGSANGGGTTGGVQNTDAGPPPPPPCTGGYVCPSNSSVSGNAVTKPYPTTNACTGTFLAMGATIPDVSVGIGCIDLTEANRRYCRLDTVNLNFLYCAGYKYALIDISASWCGYCQQEATDLPNKISGWQQKGGIVFSLLSEGPAQGSTPTKTDLLAWWSQFGTNYPMALDPVHLMEQAFPTNGGSLGLPANLIVDLRTMKVVYNGNGYNTGGQDPTFQEMDYLLSQ
jgi:hypothetical protein